jgi:hypothetical protein
MPLAPDSKLAKIRNAMAGGDWDGAIRMAARFPALGEQATDIRRANDAINNPGLYRQLGHDLEEIRQKGISALKTRFSKSWQSVKNSDKQVAGKTKREAV